MTRFLCQPSFVLPLLAIFLFGCTDKGVGDDTSLGSDVDADGFSVAAGDCDDTDTSVNPAATEVWYDGVDQNCDGANDNDQDGDTVEVDVDCDDTNAAINPDAVEVCDGDDNNCDGVVDEGSGVLGWADMDNDGYGDATAPVTTCGGDDPLIVANDDDCDDDNGEIHPGATEVCDYLDNDCDGSIDNDATDATSWYADADSDGYGEESDVLAACEQPEGYAPFDGDCDDADAAYNPGVLEDCASTEDLNCDGSLAFEDADSDGFAACEECDDADSSTFPGGVEVCDGADNDCNGTPDDAASDATPFYADFDGDTFGDVSSTISACDAPAGYVSETTDCDDSASSVFPGAAEADNLIDDDCDKWVDEDFVSAGDIIVSEITRQAYVGGTTTNTNGQWFEIYNTSSRTVDLSYWYILRTNSATSVDAYFVDPADGVTVAPGDYAVFCKTDDYEAGSGVSYPLACDYIWGDEAESSTYSGTYHDNTFNLQRDLDRLAMYVEGGSSTGRLIDDLTWTYSATAGYWARDATRSLSLDPAFLNGTSNDSLANWCSTTNSVTYQWWDGTDDDYGSPGGANYSCP